MTNSPAFTTPSLGVATATSINGLTISTTTGTLAIANGKTLTVSNTLTFTGTDGSSVNFGTGGTVLYANQSITLSGIVTGTGSTTITTSFGTFSSATFASALTDETGTGVVVFNAKPTFVGTIQTITAVAALGLDGSLGNVFTKTIGTGSTFTQSNFSTGQMFMVKITGAFTVTWFSGITWITTGAAAPTQAAITTYGFICTGSNTFDGYLVGTQ